jgi:predicted RNA-binding protein
MWDEEVARGVAGQVAERVGLEGNGQLLRMSLTGVFRYGDVVVKVIAPQHRTYGEVLMEHQVIGAAERGGVRVAEVLGDPLVVDGFVVSLLRFVECDERVELDWGEVGEQARRLHELPIPAKLRKMSSMVAVLEGRVDRLLAQGELSGGAADELRGRVRGADAYVMGSGERRVFCHGNLHSGNLLMGKVGLYMIDWEKACAGPARLDLSAVVDRQLRFGLEEADYRRFWEAYGVGDVGEEAEVEAFSMLAAVSGITYLLLSPVGRLQREGRMRLRDLLRGEQSLWTDC